MSNEFRQENYDPKYILDTSKLSIEKTVNSINDDRFRCKNKRRNEMRRIDSNLEKKMSSAIEYLAVNFNKTSNNEKPVIIHSIRIGFQLFDMGYSDNIVIGAILHDLIEDTDITYEDIKNDFGKYIADIVLTTTFDRTIKDKQAREKEVISRCIKHSQEALIIKCADILDNTNYYHLVSDIEIKERLIKKYHLFLNGSKDIIGNEEIWNQLNDRVELL